MGAFPSSMNREDRNGDEGGEKVIRKEGGTSSTQQFTANGEVYLIKRIYGTRIIYGTHIIITRRARYSRYPQPVRHGKRGQKKKLNMKRKLEGT